MLFHVYKDASGEWRWHLAAANHRTIACSGESYKNKRDCLRAIDLAKQSRDAQICECADDRPARR